MSEEREGWTYIKVQRVPSGLVWFSNGGECTVREQSEPIEEARPVTPIMWRPFGTVRTP